MKINFLIIDPTGQIVSTTLAINEPTGPAAATGLCRVSRAVPRTRRNQNSPKSGLAESELTESGLAEISQK